MISIFPKEEIPGTIRKVFELEPEVFIKTRDFYHRNKDMRHHKVVVYDNGEPVFCFGWNKNNPTNLNPDDPKVQMHLSNYWDYSTSDEGLDYSYVDRYQLMIFEELEEYSYHSARIVQAHNPQLVIVFLDKNASFFFSENEKLVITDSEEALYKKHPEFKALRTIRAFSELKWDVQGGSWGRFPATQS